MKKIKIMNEIDKYRQILNKKIQEEKITEEILKISKKIDNLVNTYYKVS